MSLTLSKIGIYTITDISNNKTYVGYSLDLNKRKLKHFYELNKGIHPNKYLQNAFNKYGEINFKFEILEECEECFLSSQENYWCNLLQSHNKRFGYNLQNTNPHKKIRKLTIEDKIKIGKSNKGKVLSIETKNKIKEKLKGNKNFAGKILPEHRIKSLELSRETYYKKIRKSVCKIDNFGNILKEYPSIHSTKKDGYNPGCVLHCCTNPNNKHKNYNWRFK